MARSDYNSPYKRFAGDWDRYKLHLDRIEEFLKTVKYDGFKSDSRVVFDATTIQRFQSEGEEYPRLHNVFLLPAKHVPIDLTELLLPENYPEFPLLPNNPIIKLEDSEYPDGFWKKDIESDVEKRKLQIERANRIAVQLSEKKSEFELIQNELRKKASVIEEGLKKGESWATELAVQTAHRKYTLPDFCLRKFEVRSGSVYLNRFSPIDK